jgi:glycosyltransferase involved in cell wall biosynthesis
MLLEAQAVPSTDRRIKVLWLIKGLGAGGAERLLQLAAELRDRHDFYVEAAYVLPWKDALVEGLESQDVPVQCLRGGAEWDLRWAARLRALLLSKNFDVIHLHSPYVAAVARLVVRTLPIRRRPRVVSTEHVPWFGYVALTRYFNRITFGLDDRHVAVSVAVKESISRSLQDDVEVIVHGIALERVLAQKDSERSRAELGMGPGEIAIGTIANFRAQKAYPDLLNAAKLVIDTGAPVTFFAVGQGPLEDEIRALHAELELGNRFVLLGEREDPAALLAGCDLFVLSSLYEGLPLAMMEAFALGLPVVATNVPGIKEGLNHGVEGLLVEVSRPDLLAAAIVELIHDPERRERMAAAAAARAQDYDIARAVRRTEEIYREVVREPSPSGIPATSRSYS